MRFHNHTHPSTFAPIMSTKQKAALLSMEEQHCSKIHKQQQIWLAHGTIITSTKTQTTTTILPLTPQPLLTFEPSLILGDSTLGSTEDGLRSKAKTQVLHYFLYGFCKLIVCKTSKQLQEFVDAMLQLLEHILGHEVNINTGSSCSCGRGVWTTQCHNCVAYQTSCTKCFIKAHWTCTFH